MADPVPVADHLLESTLYGIPMRRLVESIGLPVLPGGMLFVCRPLLGVGFPVVGAMTVAGVLVGLYVYQRTPTGQQPLAWTLARLQYAATPATYTWQPQLAPPMTAADPPLEPQDDWLTATDTGTDDTQTSHTRHD